MSNEKMREEFEAWAESDGYELDASDDERFTYAFHETECAWYGWQASRAALCVDMPRCWNDEQRDYRDDMVKSLYSAGVSYQ